MIQRSTSTPAATYASLAQSGLAPAEASALMAKQDWAPPRESPSCLEELQRQHQELDAFVADVSHDLHAPLRTIRGYCDLLQKQAGAKLSEDERELLRGAIEGAERMQQLLDALRRFARTTTSGMSEAVDCEAALELALENLQGLIAASQATVTHGPLPEIVGNRTQIVQLFQNLVANAIQYRSQQRPRVHVRSVLSDAGWTIRVRDNGIGIDPRQCERIFQMFQRLSSQSPELHGGIGLAICKRIVQRHGGRIWAESTPGHGSRFFFTIPHRPAEKPPPD